jgi:hypothetical protein
MGQQYEHFVLQHVWKTGGTEICSLAKLNGWHVPDHPGCNDFSVTSTTGWPKQDYQLIGNERSVPSNPIPRDYVPLGKYVTTGIEVHGVKWMTIFRHPFSRSLSHYHHTRTGNRREDNYTMQSFFSTPRNQSFHFLGYIPNQQTRWHCGDACHAVEPLGPQDLRTAMANLDHFDVVLILEDLKDPDSCSRRQMQSLLNWTHVHEDEPKKHTDDRGSRTRGTKWDEQVRPYLDRLGRDQNSTVAGKLWGMTGPEVMAALGLHNTLDLQLYGYARNRCEAIASRLDGEPPGTLISHNETQNETIPFQALNETPSLVSHSRMLKQKYGVPSFDPYHRLLEQQYDVPSFTIEQQRACVGLALVCFMSGYLMASSPRRRRRHL